MIKPMLAATIKPEDVKYLTGNRYYASNKIDGIRLFEKNKKLLTRTGKELPNKKVSDYIKSCLDSIRLNDCLNFDGEVVIEDFTGNGSFSQTQSLCMSKNASIPSGFRLRFYIFDLLCNVPFKDRMQHLNKLDENPTVIVLRQELVDKDLIMQYYDKERQFHIFTDRQFEGIMLREENSLYKYGRSTINEGSLIKIKEFERDTGVIIGTQELKDKYGNLKGTLGSFIVMWKDNLFNVGTGFTDMQRASFWEERTLLIGKKILFQYQLAGMKNCPRIPSFISIL